MQIIVKQSYAHINSSFSKWDTPVGRRIRNRDDYQRAMQEEGMITSEEAQEKSKNNIKDYKLSQEAHDIIQGAKIRSHKGKVALKLSDGLTQKMIDKGIIKKKGFGLESLPSAYQPKGGFYGNSK